MESPQNIKKRLKSVNNIGQITKAMELVSATKMRKSQQIALDSRPYSFAALDFLATISALENQKLPALFEVRKKINKVLFVLVSSDKGLAGAFNSSVFKKFELHFNEDKKHLNEEKLFVAVGEKSFAYLSKKLASMHQRVDVKEDRIVKKFVQAGDYTTPEQVKPLSDFLVQGYLNKDFDRVVVISTHFRSALKQEPHVRRILPIDFYHIADTIKEIIPERGKFSDLIKEHNINFMPDKKKLKEYTIEPGHPKGREKVLEKLTEHLFFMQIYHLILEANASEHSARRMAMKTASDNASELGENLNLQYNKSRQSRITTEISEISAGAEALN